VSRKPNPRLVKIHRSYNVEEAASVCRVHRGTVRNWIKNGLDTVDGGRPTLILGTVLRAHLEGKRSKRKHKCKPGEIYCVKCRVPKTPFEKCADLRQMTASTYCLVGLCGDCETIIYRGVSLKKFKQSIGDLDVAVPKALEQLVNGDEPSLNCY